MDAGVHLFLFYSIILAGLCQLGQAELTNQNTNYNNSFTITSSLNFPYTLIFKTVSKLYFNYTFQEFYQNSNGTQEDGWIIYATLDDDKIAKIVDKNEFLIDAGSPSGNITVSIKGILPGRATLYFHGKRHETKSQNLESNRSLTDMETSGQSSWLLYVERQQMPIDTAFNVTIILLVVLANIGMGAKVDLAVVKSELRRPFAPLIGLFSQFVFMPMIAFAVTCTIIMDPGIALGLFALGCSPGGSASNAYTFLLGGNISLSITMTLISTIVSIGLLPMWLFTLGSMIYRDANFKIPFENIFLSLLGIIGPVIIGLFLQKKFPRVAVCFIRAVKYIMVIFILFVLTVGVYANLYIFSLLSGPVLLSAALLPYLGFILGGLTAFICRQNLANIITIAVETGIQNTGIPIILLRMSLHGPDKDTSIVAPVASAIFTPIPLIFAIVFVRVRKYILNRKSACDIHAADVEYSDNETGKYIKGSKDNIYVTDNDLTLNQQESENLHQSETQKESENKQKSNKSTII